MKNREKINKQFNYNAFLIKMLDKGAITIFVHWIFFFGTEEVVFKCAKIKV